MPIENLSLDCELVDEVEPTYATEFEKRAAEITDLFREEIAEELRAQFDQELKDRIASMHAEGDRSSHAEILNEIAATEAAVRAKDAEIDATMANDAFNLGAVLRLKAERQELGAYLRGLLFCSGKMGGAPDIGKPQAAAS